MKESLENAKFLGLTLKNIKTFEGHDTMQGFNADVCINGKKVFHALDLAYGGCLEYRPCDSKMRNCELQEIINDLEAKLLTRPEYEYTLGGSRVHKGRDNLEIVISALVSDWEWQKVINRSKKKGILVETEKGFRTVSFKAGTITKMLKDHPQQAVAMMLQGHVQKLIKDGETILNLEYLKSLGVKV
jgi:hypothetical protein